MGKVPEAIWDEMKKGEDGVGAAVSAPDGREDAESTVKEGVQ